MLNFNDRFHAFVDNLVEGLLFFFPEISFD